MQDLSPGMFCIIPSQLLVYSGTFYGPSSTSNASKKFFFFGGFYANLCQKTNGIFLEGTMVWQWFKINYTGNSIDHPKCKEHFGLPQYISFWDICLLCIIPYWWWWIINKWLGYKAKSWQCESVFVGIFLFVEFWQIKRDESNFVWCSHALVVELAENAFWFWNAPADKHGTTMNHLALHHPKSYKSYITKEPDRGQWTRASVMTHAVMAADRRQEGWRTLTCFEVYC